MARVEHGAYRFEDPEFQTWVAAHTRRLVGTTLAGNLGSALLTFVHFRFLDPLALGGAGQGPTAAVEVVARG